MMSPDLDADEEGYSIETLSSDWNFGFVSAHRIDGLGYCGGYLILNGFGHPCEFHCSLPIHPTRTQEILYGARLEEYLVGHSIVPALLSKTRLNPNVILADTFAAISTETSLKFPTAVVVNSRLRQSSGLDESQAGERVNDHPPEDSNEVHLSIPSRLIDWRPNHLSDSTIASCRDLDCRKLKLFAAQFCITEPFQRILSALAEAQSSVAA